MTYGDKIRNMTDNELANLFYFINEWIDKDGNNMIRIDRLDRNIIKDTRRGYLELFEREIINS